MANAVPPPLPLAQPLMIAPAPWRTRLRRVPPALLRALRRGRTRLGRAVTRGPVLSLLSLGAALGVGLVFLGQLEGARIATRPPAQTAIVQPHVAQIPSRARPRTAAATGTSARSTATVYLVASPEQAVAVQAGIEDDRAAAEGQGMSTPPALVLVAGTPADAARAAETIRADQHHRLTSGRPDLRVVDLRP